MRCCSWPIIIFAITCGMLANATPARALSAETWVSGTGSNAAPCPFTAPCRTFQFALNRTKAGGTINVLSAGNFGPMTITKSVSVVTEGVEAVINTTTGGAAITVDGAGIIVSLRGLTIDLHGTANNDGISFVTGAALHVRKVSIRRAANGIRFAPASGTSELYVADSVILDNSSFGYGISVDPTGNGGAKAVLDRVRVEEAGVSGIVFSGSDTTGSITATVRDSVAAGNGGGGISAQESGGGTTNVMVDRTASVNNGYGIVTNGAGATIRIGDSTVTGNTIGLAAQAGSVIASYGTNKVNGNNSDGAAPTPVAYK